TLFTNVEYTKNEAYAPKTPFKPLTVLVTRYVPVGLILGFAVQAGAVELVKYPVVVIVHSTYFPLTTTGTIPPVCTLNTRCPKSFKMAVIVPECAVILIYVAASFSHDQSSTCLNLMACCAEVSWYTGPQTGSSIGEG